MATAVKKKKYLRSSLVIPEVKDSADHNVSFTTHDTKVVPPSFACMSQIMGSHSSTKQAIDKNVRVFVLEKHGVTTNHVKTWAAFVTRCGFKCSFIAPAKDTNCVGILQFNREDYVNVTHFKIGLTAGRYLGYHYAQGFKDIPHMATFLYEKFPDLDAYQALILAHYGNPVGTYFDAGHGMIKFASGCPKLLTKEQFLKRMEKHDNYNVNSDCTEYTAKYKAGELLEKGKAGKWEELIELLSK